MESNNIRTTDSRGGMKNPESPADVAMRRAGLLQAVAQLDMLVGAFDGMAPANVVKAGKEFREALKEWADAK